MEQPTVDDRTAGLGLRVLLVEDDTMLSMMLEDALSILGCTVIKAARVAEGAALAASADADVAVLDVNIAGQHVYPVAAALRRRGIPFIFVTAYVRDGVPPEYAGAPLLHKPFRLAELEDLLRRTEKPVTSGSR
jgi:DNA-binding response OmpR family regulator